jgi:transcriptional regulator with XRE-family HTH domain
MEDRTDILRQFMQLANISSFQNLSDYSGVSRRAIDTLRKGNATNLKYADLVKLAEVLKIEVKELIAKFIDNRNDAEACDVMILNLREEYQILQQKMEQQKLELRSQFERETLQQLESLILQLPSAVYAAKQNPSMSAQNILPLLRPIDALLQRWGIAAIGAVGMEVRYDPQQHQLIEGSELEVGDLAIVRYVGYMQGEKLLYRARVAIAN